MHYQAVTTALFYLATHPEYVQPMREEVEAVIDAEGWTKAAVAKLWKVDSFLKESQRLSGGGLCMCRTSPDSAFFPHFYLLSYRDAQSSERFHIFERDDDPRGIYDQRSSPLCAPRCSSCSIYQVFNYLEHSRLGKLSRSRYLRRVSICKNARAGRRKHKTWNGNTDTRFHRFWTRAPCMVRIIA